MSELLLTGDAIDSIAQLAQKAAELTAVRDIDDLKTGQKLIILNDGTTSIAGEKIKDWFGLDLVEPSRISRKILIQTADSLVDYLATFKVDGTTLFADIARNRIVACHPDMNARNLHLDHLQEIRSVACEKPGWKRRQLCDGGTDRCYPMTLCEKGS